MINDLDLLDSSTLGILLVNFPIFYHQYIIQQDGIWLYGNDGILNVKLMTFSILQGRKCNERKSTQRHDTILGQYVGFKLTEPPAIDHVVSVVYGYGYGESS